MKSTILLIGLALLVAGCGSGYVETTNPATASGNKRTKGGQPANPPATASTAGGQ